MLLKANSRFSSRSPASLLQLYTGVTNTHCLQHGLQRKGKQPLGMYGTGICHDVVGLSQAYAVRGLLHCIVFFDFLIIICSLLHWVCIHGGLSFIKDYQYSFITCVVLPLCGFTYLLTCPCGISNIQVYFQLQNPDMFSFRCEKGAMMF